MKKHAQVVVEDEIDLDPDEELDPTPEQLAQAKPFAEAFPELLANMQRRARGRPRVAKPKAQVTLRLNPDVLDYYRATGPGWQGRINDVLVESIRKAK